MTNPRPSYGFSWDSSHLLSRIIVIWAISMVVPIVCGCVITLISVWLQNAKELGMATSLLGFALGNAFGPHNAAGILGGAFVLCLLFLRDVRPTLLGAVLGGIAASFVKCGTIVAVWYISTREPVHPEYYQSLVGDVPGYVLATLVIWLLARQGNHA